MSVTGSVVIIGAGQAGSASGAMLRQFGFAGAVTIIGDESLGPYHRPPLSKAWLQAGPDDEALLLRPMSFYAENKITLLLGARVTRVDRSGKAVELDNGGCLPYDYLIFATGRRPRRLQLSGCDLPDVLELRTVADAKRLQAILKKTGIRLAVIGAGYIGLEASATAIALGAEVVVIEREPSVLPRVAGKALAAYLEAYHRRRGVHFELAADVEAFEADGGRLAGVRLSDGRRVPADAALIGIGALANDELASAASLECENGIVVDLTARTSDPSIYAVGDCSRRPLPHYDRIGHLESVQNALEQARQAAAHVTERPPPPAEVPWFWSDQYDLKLQIAGLRHGAVQSVMRGSPSIGECSKFSVFHLTNDSRVCAVEAINSPGEFMAGRQLIGSRRTVDANRIGDLSMPIKTLVN